MTPLIPSRAQAPGKLLLLGEYAVLNGAPAIVAALDRYASAQISPTDDDGCLLLAPDIHPQPIPFALTNAGPSWPVERPDSVSLVDAMLHTAVEAELLTPGASFRLTLANADFYHHGDKLGIGSSAAITVALCRALLAATQQDPDLADTLAPQVHHRFQGGQGSGSDIAAALRGGVISFCKDPTEPAGPHAQRLSWPADLHWRCFWTGRSTSTRDFLSAVEQLKNRDSASYEQCMKQLADLAESGLEAFAAGDGPGFCGLVSQYRSAMAALGRAADIDIVSRTHHALAQLAEQAGVAYKPSGAGGGDIGVAFGEPMALNGLVDRAAEAGAMVLEVGLAPATEMASRHR